MGLNSAANAVYFGVLLYVLIGYAIMFSIGNEIDSQLKAEVTKLGIDPGEPYNSLYDTTKSLYITSTKFLLWFLVGLTIVSSFIDAGTFKSYILGSMAAIITSALITLIGTIVWNSFVSDSLGFLDFTDLQDGFLFLAENFTALIIINLVAGLASFVWKQEPSPFLRGYV